VKRLHGEATAIVEATSAQCLSVLAAVEGYPRWYPDVVREAEVLATGQDGLPTRAQVKLHVSRGPLEKDFRLLMEVCVETPGKVTLTRIPHEASDEETFQVAWEIEERGQNRHVRLSVDACLAVPRFLPLGSIGDELAAGFVSAVAPVLQGGPAPL